MPFRGARLRANSDEGVKAVARTDLDVVDLAMRAERKAIDMIVAG